MHKAIMAHEHQIQIQYSAIQDSEKHKTQHSCNTMTIFFLHVRNIIHSLKVVDYLHIQAENPWYNYYLTPRTSCAISLKDEDHSTADFAAIVLAPGLDLDNTLWVMACKCKQTCCLYNSVCQTKTRRTCSNLEFMIFKK